MKTKLKLLAAAAALAVSGTASAVNIGGLDVPGGAHLEIASIFENPVFVPGNVLSGVGEVTQINGAALNCAGCELTYRFGGYTVTAVGGGGTSVDFTGGWVNFYLGFGANNDFNPYASANSVVDVAAATNGALFLTLAGHSIDALGNTLHGTGANIGTPTPVGSGGGLLDVDLTGLLNGNLAGPGAIANGNFNTNSLPAAFGGAFADFIFTSSFGTAVPPHPAECPGGPECVAGSADLRGQVIPEPATLALMGLGLVGFAASGYRRKS